MNLLSPVFIEFGAYIGEAEDLTDISTTMITKTGLICYNTREKKR